MNKKAVTAAAAVLAVVCVVTFLILGGVIKLKPKEDESESDKSGFDTSAYLSEVKYQSDALSANYLPTFIDGIYYTADTMGNVKFYDFNTENDTFTERAADGTYDVSVKMSEQNIKAKVSYIKADGKTAGYGLYTPTIAGDTDSIYRYVFFAVTDMPSGMGSSSNLLLLADSTENNFRNAEKLYGDQFSFNPEKGSAERIYSEANRYVGSDGTKRADYAVVTDYIIKNELDNSLFISGRHYAEDEDKYDLMKAGGRGNNVDNVLVEKNIVGRFVKATDDGVLYLTEDADKNVVLKKVDSDEAVKTFECKREDIIVSGDYFFMNNSVYNVNDSSSVELKGDFLANFKADMFACNGKTAFLRGYIDKTNPAVVIADLTTGECRYYVNNMFANIVNPEILSDSSVMFTTVTGSDASTFKYFVVK